MNIGPWQLAIVAILILVLFGRGRISEMMGDFGKGIKSFKQGMNEEARTQDRIDHQSPAPKASETTATPTPTASGDSEKSS